ncbi:MAG: LPXTG cell wall anchor domain-containing protein, partial [Clostridia bacterium]|nr:LPXTG cell wall anchor domain-containing protein [Clostridia bacterium]
ISNGVVFNVTLKSNKAGESGKVLNLLPNRTLNVNLNLTGFTKKQLTNAKIFHIVNGTAEPVTINRRIENGSKLYFQFSASSFSPYAVVDIASPVSTPDANDQPVAKDAKGNTYAAKDIKISAVRYSTDEAKKHIETARKSSDGKNIDFSRAVVFEVNLTNANGDTLTLLPKHSVYVDLDMTAYKESELKNAALFHIAGDSAESVLCWTITNDSGKCWIRFSGSSFSPYVVANIGATTSTGTDNNPGTGDFSALPIILIGAAALLGIGGVLVYRKKKADAE